MINRLIALSVATMIFAACSSTDTGQKDATTVGDGGWTFEGWGGAPEQRNDGKTPRDTSPKDWYYIKFSSRASAKAVAKKSQAMMQSTCREASRLQGASDVVKKMVGETVEAASGVSDGEATASVIVSQSQGVVKGVGVYECKATGSGSDPKDVSKDNWEECQCVIYAKFPGGKDALVAKAQEVSNKQ
ncbi:lipoprotein LipL21 [Leptospira kmetyi]|uniref:Lipoprotein LipL21 n=1 Tax=Leptospira kmetyi TaxID=408139 RepID=A0A2M9XP19_9LEPT|nr:lipoprotein LipL21 [Leptospira kmetyi]AYV55968.1 lipoprotein LipL21 [Leptospira kmetyi]PJZ31373.1 lipoprotein LipL21 [Leptospira kmetyi]PJZ41065.1 lipoprotein LipL21 [Leptospira kmetyi]TGK16218.1 lipoprotein LipL21 [Leptospira kmetyi]TGK32248.1 lipoprotein LipL21 [Leptospira kmetyi]